MTKKTRLIILLICIALFIFITPGIIFYSLGYRYDFKNNETVATGGIYIKAEPLGSDIIINNTIEQKTGLFSTYVFVQNLLPKNHTVLIKKEGYADYQKTLPVKENEVTKLEHVTLFKPNPRFEILQNEAQSPFTKNPIIAKYNLKNNNLYVATLADPIIKNIIAFKEHNGILWLGSNGFLYQSNQNGENTRELNTKPFTINKKNNYQILTFGNHIFIQENTALWKLNNENQTIETFASDILDTKISPDGQKMAYWNHNTIFLYYLTKNNDSYDHPQKVSLPALSESIKDLFWINSDYLMIVTPSRILISEIDARNNVNTITLPETLTFAKNQTFNIKDTKILFNDADKKIYLLSGKTTLVSERLIP